MLHTEANLPPLSATCNAAPSCMPAGGGRGLRMFTNYKLLELVKDFIGRKLKLPIVYADQSSYSFSAISVIFFPLPITFSSPQQEAEPWWHPTFFIQVAIAINHRASKRIFRISRMDKLDKSIPRAICNNENDNEYKTSNSWTGHSLRRSLLFMYSILFESTVSIVLYMRSINLQERVGP